MLDNTEEAIMKGQSKDTGNFGYTRHRTKTNNTTNTIQKTKKMSHTENWGRTQVLAKNNQFLFLIRRVWRYQKGNQNPYIEEKLTTQWPKEKVQKYKMFRKLNKPQITKIKQQNCIGIRAFDSRLYLDISRSFKWKESFIFRYFNVFQVSQMFTYSLPDLLLLAIGSLVVFVLRECILNVHILVSSEHKLCQIWNTCIVFCIYWSVGFLNKLLIFVLSKAYYQESYILNIEHSSVVIVAEWLHGSFEGQNRF